MIAADMRQLADDIAAGRAIVGQSVWRSYADRVEKIGTGNIAKMREAVKKCLLYIACAESVGIGTITLNDKVKLDPKKIIKSAKEALAALPRNCERFQTWPEAYENYWNEQGDPADWRKLGAWLFATAKEGRGDESPRTGQEGEVGK